jgi:hypothetical protein
VNPVMDSGPSGKILCSSFRDFSTTTEMTAHVDNIVFY